MELQIGASDSERFANPGASVVQEQQERMITRLAGFSTIDLLEHSFHFFGLKIGRDTGCGLLRWQREHLLVLGSTNGIVAHQMAKETMDGGKTHVARGSAVTPL